MNHLTHIIASVAVVLIVVGLANIRRSPKTHGVCMLLAFLIDLGLVLYIEFSRGAIDKVASAPEGLLLFHVIVSSLTLVLYVVQLVLGWRLLTGKPASRTTHRWCGIAFLVFKTSGFVTSFMV